ncbi:hypothetical protein GOBAR_DD09051 [Gossypium barbadense]|nr:hypothetical protein GOBAR_DD09051 [Gossypium barbadense]
MSEMRSLSESAEAWLRDKDPRTWSRAHFSTRCKSDLLLNNNSECFNKFLTLKCYFVYSIWPIYVGNEKYEVDCGLGNKHVVDLLNSSCSCRKWDLSGIPCPMQWEHVRDMEPILPPIIRRPPGRPKQIRRKEIDEVRKSGSKLSKTGHQANCSKCGKPGHNTRTCKGIVGGNQMASQSSSLQNLNQATSMDNTSSQPPLTQQSSNLRANFRAKLPFKRKSIL